MKSIMITRISFSIFILVLLLFAGCQTQPNKPEPTYPVEIGTAIARDTPIFVNAVGNVFSLYTVQVRPQVSGEVLEAYVKQGGYVRKGQKLYKIDPRPYQAALDEAKAALLRDQASLEFAEIRLVRYADLVKRDYFAKVNYEQFVTEAESLKGQVLSDVAAVELAKINLDWCTPLSPITGRLSQYNIDPGNVVTAYDPNFLIDIRQINPADIRFAINQKDFVRVQEAIKDGQLKFNVALPQKPDEQREGKIYFIDNHIDLTTGTILIKGTVPNKDEFFWPGEFVRVRLQLKVIPNAVLIPEEAVQFGQEGSYVYIFHPETSEVEYRKVTKGETIDRFTLIEEGVSADEKVVLKGQLNLLPGVKVTVVDQKGSTQKNRKTT